MRLDRYDPDAGTGLNPGAAPNPDVVLNRRTVLKTLGTFAAGLALPGRGFAGIDAGSSATTPNPSKKPLRGLFPIASSPFTEDNKLDLECLAAEVDFCNRARVPGIIWPQLASGWSTLSADERFAGAERMLSAGKGGKTAVVIGVQTKGYDVPGAVAFAKHAAQHGADGICSLPPQGDDAAVIKYYQAVGSATDLPLFVQTSGADSKFPVDLVAEIFRNVPTMQVVKDEAGDPIARIGEIREKTDDRLAVFAGKGGRQLMDELRLGFQGLCPAFGLADLFQEAWELYEAGKPREAFDMFGRIEAFSSIDHADEYVLMARGIFKETTRSRPKPGMGGASAEAQPMRIDEASKKVVRDALNMYLKPYLRA